MARIRVDKTSQLWRCLFDVLFINLSIKIRPMTKKSKIEKYGKAKPICLSTIFSGHFKNILGDWKAQDSMCPNLTV